MFLNNVLDYFLGCKEFYFQKDFEENLQHFLHVKKLQNEELGVINQSGQHMQALYVL